MKEHLRLRIPGSTGNLGPGFDALGLALGMYTTLSFDLVDDPEHVIPIVRLEGKTAQFLENDHSNIVYSTIATLWKDDPKLISRLRITIDSEIPLSRGLGSSGAAVLGAIWAATALKEQHLEPGKLLLQATQIEGHPDNVAASLLGGLVCSSRSLDSQQIITQKIDWPHSWKVLLVVPSHTCSTAAARAVLPTQVSMADAVNNLQKTALLVAAVHNRCPLALQEALHDKLHEPYREQLVPELPELRLYLKEEPIIGCVLSGAGPSVLVLVEEQHQHRVHLALKEWLATKKEPPTILNLEVDNQGLQEVHDYKRS